MLTCLVVCKLSFRAFVVPPSGGSCAALRWRIPPQGGTTNLFQIPENLIYRLLSMSTNKETQNRMRCIKEVSKGKKKKLCQTNY